METGATRTSSLEAADGHAGLAACVACGGRFAKAAMVEHDGAWVCPDCNQTYFERLRPSVATAAALPYASFGTRWAAKSVDALLLGVAQMALFIWLGLSALLDGFPADAGALRDLMSMRFIYVALRACYSSFFLGRWGATPGKMLFGLRVVRPDGGPLTYGRGFARAFAELVSVATFGLGYLVAAFDSESRALHDRLADTRVVRRSR